MESKRFFRWTLVPAAMRALPRPIKIFSIITLIYTLGWGIIGPYLPLFFKEQLGTYTGVGLVSGLLPLFSIFWSLALGEILDKVSKRSIISFVLLLYLPLSTILLGMKTLGQFTLFRIYHSGIASAFWVAGEAYVRVHSPKGKEASAIGAWDFAGAGALTFGALLGASLIGIFGWSLIYAVSICAGLALVASIIYLPDHDGKPFFPGLRSLLKAGLLRQELRDMWAAKKLLYVTIFAFFFLFGWTALGMVLPLFLDSIGADFIQIGLITAAYYASDFAEPLFAATKRPRRVVFIGILISTLLFVVLFFVKNLAWAFILSVLLGFAISAVYPILLGKMGQLMPRNKVGEFSAVTYAIRGIGAGLGPIIAGLMSDLYGLQYAFLLCGIVFAGMMFFIDKMEF